MEAAVAIPSTRSPGRVRPWLLPSGVLLASALLFTSMWIPEVVNRSRLNASMPSCDVAACHREALRFVYHFWMYAAFALPGIALALVGGRRLSWIPFVVPVLVLWPWARTDPHIMGDIAPYLGPTIFRRSDLIQREIEILHPTGLIPPMPWEIHPLSVLVISSVLVLLPAWFFGRHVLVDRQRPEVTANGIVALGICWLAVPSIQWLLSTHIADRLRIYEALDWAEPWLLWASIVFIFAALLGRRRPAWPWVHLGIPLLVGLAVLAVVLSYGTFGDTLALLRGWLATTVALVLVAWSAAHQDRVSAWMERSRMSGNHILGLLAGSAGIYFGARMLLPDSARGVLPWEARGVVGTGRMLMTAVILPAVLGLAAVGLGGKDRSGSRGVLGRSAALIGEVSVALAIIWALATLVSLIS